MSETQPVMQHVEEEKYGQGRAFTTGEVDALIKLTIFLAFVGVILGVLIGGGIGLFVEPIPFWKALWGGAAAGATLAAIPILRKAVDEMIDGLRSYEHRKGQNFGPPQPASLPHPPILVHPLGKKEPYLLTEPEMPSREPLRLTPGTIAEILQLVLERNNGTWSRRTLTRLRLATGEKLSRGVYEQLTPWLFKAGVLEQEPQGGFRILAEDLEELREIFPNLPVETGRAGGGPGNRSQDKFSDTRPVSREVGTLAERRAQEWLECNCDAKAYLERRRNHD